MVYCSICSTNMDPRFEGSQGDIGIIPVAFCTTCQTGIKEFAMEQWGLVEPTYLCEICQEVVCECQPCPKE